MDAQMTKRIFQEYGIKAATSLGLSFDADISNADPDVAKGGEALLNQALDVTHAMGATHMCGILYSALGKYSSKPSPQGRANCVAALQRVAKRCAALPPGQWVYVKW